MLDITLAELMQLPASRELDYAIAELLGEKPPEGALRDDVLGDWVVWDEEVDVESRSTLSWATRWPAPRSTDVAWAWPLLAEMLAAGIEFIISARHPAGTLLFVPCAPDDAPELSQVKVPTIADAPLAIVRAYATWKYGKGGEE